MFVGVKKKGEGGQRGGYTRAFVVQRHVTLMNIAMLMKRSAMMWTGGARCLTGGRETVEERDWPPFIPLHVLDLKV